MPLASPPKTFVADTELPASDLNNFLSDIYSKFPVFNLAETITGAWTYSATQTYSGAVVFSGNVTFRDSSVFGSSGLAILPDGAEGAPSLTVGNDSDTGLYQPNDNQLAISTGGSKRLTLTSTAATFANNLIVQGQGYSEAFALTDAATIAVNCDNANVFTVTLGGNRTLGNPTNLKAGGTYVFVVTQDGTGSRTLAYGSAYNFPAGVAPVLTTTAAAVDVLAFVSPDGTNLYGNILHNLS